MAPAKDDSSSGTRIGSFAVLDLETCNLPCYNFNKTSIIELSIYGIAANELEKVVKLESTPKRTNEAVEEVQEGGKITTKVGEAESAVKQGEQEEEGDAQSVKSGATLPASPRVLRKLTLPFNPRMMIHPEAEKITGLDNYMLEYESTFDENAAQTVMGFLKCLKQPICLVAHNGLGFDFPIVKEVLDKLKVMLPAEWTCVDSMKAFHQIDIAREKVILLEPPPTLEASIVERKKSESSVDLITDWRTLNETTPKRPPKTSNAASPKRRISSEPGDCETPVSSLMAPAAKKPLKSRRSLFKDDTNGAGMGRKRVFPPKGVYKLDNMYERIFKQKPETSHEAEADVLSLMRLMLHYGEDFLSYAEKYAIPFVEVRKVGASTNL